MMKQKMEIFNFHTKFELTATFKIPSNNFSNNFLDISELNHENLEYCHMNLKH